MAGLLTGVLLTLMGAGGAWYESSPRWYAFSRGAFTHPTEYRTEGDLTMPKLRIERLEIGDLVLSGSVTSTTTGTLLDVQRAGMFVQFPSQSLDLVNTTAGEGAFPYDAAAPDGEPVGRE